MSRCGPTFVLICSLGAVMLSDVASAEEGTAAPEAASEPVEAATELAVLGCLAPPRLLDLIPRLYQGVEAALASAGAGSLGLDEARRRLDQARAGNETDERVRDLRDRARTLFLAFEFEEALEALDRARQILRERYGELLRDPLLARVDLDRARVLQDLNQDHQARLALYQAALVRPDLEPEPDTYPPRLIEAWNELRELGHTEEPRTPALDIARLVELGRILELRWIVSIVAGPAPEEGSIGVELILIDVEQGEPGGRAELGLSVEGSWGPALDEAVAELLSEAALPPEPQPVEPGPPAPPPTRLLVLTTPSGAHLTIDGSAHGGRTPALVEVDPGTHHVTISLDGYRQESRDVIAWANQTRPLEVQLEADTTTRWYRTWWFWTIVGVVVTGAAAGIATWAVIYQQDQPDVGVEVLDLSLR